MILNCIVNRLRLQIYNWAVFVNFKSAEGTGYNHCILLKLNCCVCVLQCMPAHSVCGHTLCAGIHCNNYIHIESR